MFKLFLKIEEGSLNSSQEIFFKSALQKKHLIYFTLNSLLPKQLIYLHSKCSLNTLKQTIIYKIIIIAVKFEELGGFT